SQLQNTIRSHFKYNTMNFKFMICIFSLTAIVESVSWKDCGSKAGKIASVNVTGCEAEGTCSLKHGTNVTVSACFVPSEVVKTVKANVHGVLSIIPVPFPLSNPDGCVNSNLQCPLQAGKQYCYRSSIFVRPEYPKLKLVVKWELQDQASKDVICFVIPAVITD
ncbi:unnamed protein product, partial [Owenia fusiformis]